MSRQDFYQTKSEVTSHGLKVSGPCCIQMLKQIMCKSDVRPYNFFVAKLMGWRLLGFSGCCYPFAFLEYRGGACLCQQKQRFCCWLEALEEVRGTHENRSMFNPSQIQSSVALLLLQKDGPQSASQVSMM